MTRKDFQNSIESFLIGARGWYCCAEVAEANGYQSYIEHWRSQVERILFIDLTFFINTATTKTAFDRRQALNEIIAEHNSAKGFQSSLLVAKKVLAARYLKRSLADLKLTSAWRPNNLTAQYHRSLAVGTPPLPVGVRDRSFWK